MKQLLFTFILAMTCTVGFTQSTAEDDNENGTSLAPILIDMTPFIEGLEEEGIEIVRMEIDILMNTKTTTRTLHQGWSYGIAAIGDYRFKDLDLKIYRKIEGNWIMVGEDIDEDKEAMVIIEPEETEEYMIEIISAETAEGYSGGHYGLLIFHE